jgi:hypothetical protein
MADDSGRPGPREPWLRMWRRHWLTVPLVVGVASFVIQAAFYSIGSKADVIGSAAEQALLNFVIAAVGSIWLRLRWRKGSPHGHPD